MPLNNPKFISTLASSITGSSGTNDDDRLKDGSDTLNANLINTLNIASAGSFVASGGNITITAGSTYSAYALTEIKYFRDGKYKTLAAVSAQEPTWAKNTANDWFGLIVIAANDAIAFRGSTTLGNTIVDGALPLEGDIPIAAVQISKSLANNATNRKVQFLGMNKLNSEFTAVDNGNVRLTINKGGTLTHRPSSTDYTITLPSATGTLALSGANVNYSQLIGTQPNIDADKITSGTIPDARIASASTWNTKQDALTFGKANTNALKLEETVSTNDILQAGTNQVKGLTYAQLKSALAIGLTDVSGDLDDIADGSNHKKIPNADATKISNLTVSGAIDLDSMKVKSDRLTVTGAIDVDAINTKVAGIAAGATVGATSSQISDIAANTAKTGITSSQATAISNNTNKISYTDASAVSANTAKVGITTTQANAITANSAKTGITSTQANAITANTAKVGITTTQANAITANSAKVGITSTQASDITAAKTRTDTLTDAYIETKAANKIDALLGADSNAIDTLAELEDYLLDSSVAGGVIQSLAGKVSTSTTVNGHALSGNISITKANIGLGSVTDGATVGATTAQANAIALNTAKTGITSAQATAISNNSAKTGITSTQAGHITANNNKISYTDASAVSANTAKTGITTSQANAITANTAKTGITSTQAGHITTNNAKVGITSTQADAITANTSKVGITTSQANAITANTAKTGITSSQASAITANTAKTGITSTQATDIIANTSKPKIFYGTSPPTSTAVGDLWHKTDEGNLVHRANAVGVNTVVTTGDGWYVHLTPTNKLKSAVSINGVAFDGSANVTVAAAAGTLTGNTLASGITSSSLTAVGTIATGTWNATAIDKDKVSTSGTWADADIAQTSVTQYEGNLSIGNSQLSGATNLGKAILGATNLGNSETKFLKIATDGSGNHTITARTDAQIRSDIGAGTSNLAVGNGSGDALAGNTSIPVDLTVSGAGTVHASNYTNTTYSVMDTNNGYAAGLVKGGNGTHGNKFLRQDGEWQVPPSESGGITSLAGDSTPQLGGDLDANGNKIKAIGNADLIFEKAQGSFLFKDTDSANASVTIGPSSMKFDFQTEGGASGGEAVLQYVDSGGAARNFMTVSSNAVALENRAANGEVHVYGNTSTAGSSGRVLVTTFADTAVTTQKKIIVNAQGEGISFADSDESHFVTLKPHATTTSSYDIKLPAAQGGANTILKNDGSGNLSWAADNDTTYANLAALDSTANTKLSGIATNANNYTHPTYSTDNIDTANAEVIDTIETNSTGHVTAMTKRTMTLANLGYTGATDANNYSHPTGAGNNHIPSGGASGQFLKYNSSGVAVWAAPSYTTSLAYSAITGKPSTFAPTIGNTSATAMAGNTTTITTAQANAITANTAKATNVSTNLGVSTSSTTIDVTSSDGNNATLPVATDSAGGVMSAAMFSKLNGIEASADVTDTANVKNALGAAMPSNALAIGDASSTITISGNLVVSGTTKYSDETIQIVEDNKLAFRAGDGNTHEVILTASDASADRIITLPDSGGVVAVSASTGVALDNAGNLTANLSATHIPSLAASKITSGTFNTGRIPSLAASKITSGTFATARIADDAITGDKIASNTIVASNMKFSNASVGSDQDNMVVTYDHASTGFTLVSAAAGGENNQSITTGAGIGGANSGSTGNITLEIDSTVATLTGNQTLQNKTIAISQITELSNLTASEGAQLENIQGATISSAQWGYVGGLTANKVIDWTGANAGTLHSSNYNNDNTQNVFTSSFVDSSENAILRLTKSGASSGTQDLTFVAGSNVTLTPSGGNLTIASTDTNTTYSVGDGGLTQNNFTNALKSKLDGIAASANNFSLPTADGSTLGGIKVGTNLSINGSGVLSSTDTNTNQLTQFKIHDGDDTEVIMAHNRVIKFVEGNGLDINFTDTSTGSDADPFDLTFKIADNGVGADQLNVSGNGTSGYVLTSDADGSFSWSAKTTNTNTTYSAGTGLTLSSTTFSHTAHTGEVTGSTALTIADNVVDEANLKISNTGSNGQFLSKQSGNTGGLTWATPTDTNTFRTITAGGNTLGATETLAFTAGSNVTITESNGAVTIASTDTNTNTTYSAGTNISLSGTTFNVDDAFLKNNANDTTSGTITAAGFSTTGSITLGGHTFNDIDIGTEHVDSDNHIMSSGAIKEYVDANGGGATNLDGLSDAKSAGTDFTGSLLIGHQNHGTLSSAVYNTGVGLTALDALTTADNTTALGYGAGTAVTTGGNSVFVGTNAGNTITTNERVVSIGTNAGKNSGFGEVSLGFWAGIWNLGLNNVNIGYAAGARGTTGANDNISIGNMAGGYSGDGTFEGHYNIFLGHNSGNQVNGASNYNIGIGRQTLFTLDDGSEQNIAIGYNAGYAVSTGDDNILIGSGAGENITTGSDNVIIGGIDASAADVNDSLIVASGDGGVTWITGNSNGFVTHANGSDHTFVIVGEEGDLYAGTGSTGNANGYQFSYGNGRTNVTQASNGTDFGINVPHNCVLERIDVVFGNSGNVSSGTTTFVVVKNGSNQSGNLSTNHTSGIHDTHHTGLNYAFTNGDRFNLRTTTSSRQVGPIRMTARFRRTG